MLVNLRKGFTLLELLVVIGIIGVLVSLFTVSYTNAQKTSRDSRRRQDLAAIQNAMEQYYGANSYTYPVCSGQTCAALNSYFSGGAAIPTDPMNSGSYVYSFTSVAGSYTVSAILEKNGSTISVSNLQ